MVIGRLQHTSIARCLDRGSLPLVDANNLNYYIMEKVADFINKIKSQHGEEISKRTLDYLLSWASSETKISIWNAFFEKDLLKDMLNYALADFKN